MMSRKRSWGTRETAANGLKKEHILLRRPQGYNLKGENLVIEGDQRGKIAEGHQN